MVLGFLPSPRPGATESTLFPELGQANQVGALLAAGPGAPVREA